MGRIGWTCVAALLLAGCADPVASIDVEPDDPEPVVAKRGAIYVDFRSPAGIDEEYRWSLSAMAPDGTALEGQEYFEHPEGTACWFWDLNLDDDVGIEEPCCDNPAQVDGDLRCADAPVGPYVHFLFEDVAYNGTWTVDVALEYAHRVGGEETGHPDLQSENKCTHLRLTEPNATFRGGALPESECIMDGTVTFDYATRAWNYTLADVVWCYDCWSP